MGIQHCGNHDHFYPHQDSCSRDHANPLAAVDIFELNHKLEDTRGHYYNQDTRSYNKSMARMVDHS